jgi:small subunit ribosomal protein S8
MSHILSNTLTQLRNSNALSKRQCRVPFTKLNESFLTVLKEAGYIGGIEKIDGEPRAEIEITMIPGRLHELKVVSTPGRRQYVGYREMPVVKNGLGDVIISTPQGIMTGVQARAKKIGGELICRLA